MPFRLHPHTHIQLKIWVWENLLISHTLLTSQSDKHRELCSTQLLNRPTDSTSEQPDARTNKKLSCKYRPRCIIYCLWVRLQMLSFLHMIGKQYDSFQVWFLQQFPWIKITWGQKSVRKLLFCWAQLNYQKLHVVVIKMHGNTKQQTTKPNALEETNSFLCITAPKNMHITLHAYTHTHTHTHANQLLH